MKQKKILVVDDEPDTIAFVSSVIEEMGDYSVLSATNGDEALQKARTEFPDLIILDVIMPKKDGFTTFCELKQDDKTVDIPIIMLSGLHEMGDMVRAGAMPIDAKPELFIDKPIEPIKLKNLIDEVLKKQETS
jgi:CheY-like chemotaxis protein